MVPFDTNTKIFPTTTTFKWVVVLMFVTVVGMAQNTVEDESFDIVPISNTSDESTRNSEISTGSTSGFNFVLWFMGSNQKPNTAKLLDAQLTRIKVISTGLEPNRILLKSFFRKVTHLNQNKV